MNEEVSSFLKTFDVLCLNETHFNERIKCPDGFVYEGRSEKIESKIPRGGVAIYKNKQCELHVEVLCSTLRDCIIFGIKNTDIVIAAQYIPPINSSYYSDMYIENLKFMYEKYKNKKFLLLGDLNARIGDISHKDPTITHCINPDTRINSHGRHLLQWLEERQDMVILNGLVKDKNRFD